MSRFVVNREATKQLAREPWARELLADATNALKEEAQRASPLGSDFVGYQGRFKTRVNQLSATVGNTDVAAHIVEFGSRNNPPYAPLRQGVAATGMRFADRDRPSEI